MAPTFLQVHVGLFLHILLNVCFVGSFVKVVYCLLLLSHMNYFVCNCCLYDVQMSVL